MEDESQSEQEQPQQSAYNKKSIWKWVAIYGIIALIVYGLIYYLFIAKRNTSSPYQTSVPEPTAQQNQQVDESSQMEVSSDSGSMAEPQEVNISLTKDGFVPQSITVKAGTKVVWTNNSGALATVDSSVHPTHLDYPPLNLGQFADGETLSLVFDTPGTYQYHDHLHATRTGTVIVE